MQTELHKKYDLRSRKRSRVQENEGEQQVPTPSQNATPQEVHLAKQVNKGKQQLLKIILRGGVNQYYRKF